MEAKFNLITLSHGRFPKTNFDTIDRGIRPKVRVASARPNISNNDKTDRNQKDPLFWFCSKLASLSCSF